MDDHKCPKDGCEIRVPFNTLACRPHWFSLPINLRGEISRAWRNNDLVRHAELRQQAVTFLNGTADPQGPGSTGGPG